MPNLSQTQNPLDYPAYVPGLRPVLPESLGRFVEDELSKLQTATDNLAYASAAHAEAKVNEERIARATETEALAATLERHAARMGGAEAQIEEVRLAYASADEAIAGRAAKLEAAVGDPATGISAAHSKITAEETARASADSALASRASALEATVNNASTGLSAAHSKITAEETARASADSALASRTTALESTVNNDATGLAAAHSKISTEATARANGDSANATAISNLSTTVGGHAASISSHASSIDGLRLRYSVTLDSNGHITGFEQNNNGKSGQFIIRADVFKVVSPGQTPQTMFQVDANGVHFTGKSSVTGLTAGTLNADVNMGSGRIIWDNGQYMKVAGVGFGSMNQFIEWFGPKMAINACAESNAISYLKTNGDAYFGGSLSAGTLKNSGETSSLAANAAIEVGPSGSNGGIINVVLSYTHSSQQTYTYSPDTAGVRDWEAVASGYGWKSGMSHTGTASITGGATIYLYRAVGAGGYSHVATLTVTGGTETFTGIRPMPGDANGSATIRRAYTGTVTFTDSLKTAQDRKYKAEIVSRSAFFLSTNQAQRVAIIATE